MSKEKGKKVQYVPSRYMQKSISVWSEPSKEKSYLPGSSSDKLQLSVPSTSGSTLGKTSTPTKEQVLLSVLDESAIPNVKDRPVQRKLGKLKNAASCSSLDVSQYPVSLLHEGKKEINLAECELDLMHASYLQATFLESEAKKALEMRSSNVMETLHKLFALFMKYFEDHKSQKAVLKVMSSVKEIHRHCEKQDSILKPIFEILPSLEENYKNLAEAVNSRKQYLRVQNVLLPEPCSEVEIIEAVEKMKKFMETFFELVPNHQEIVSASDLMQNVIDTSQLLTEAFRRGLILLIESMEKVTSEALLQLSQDYL